MSKKWLGWATTIVLLITAAGFGYWRFRRAHQQPDITYKTAPVERRHLVGRITATGTLSALVTVQVGSQVSGRVQQTFVDFNSRVKKGELIAKLDPQLFQAAVEQAGANLSSARASLVKAESDVLLADSQLARAKAMHAQSVGTQAELDVAEATARNAHAQVEVAKAALEQSRAGLNQAKVNLSYTNIVSPIDGVVISRAVDVGQTVAASLQAPVLFTLAEDLRKMQVDTNVSEGDVGRLDVGMPAWFTVDAFPGKRFRGTIATIRNAPQTVQNVVTYDAVIKVDNDELRLRPGMTANVTVTYAEKDHVLAVPNTALRFKPPQGSPGASLASAAASSGSAPRGGGPGSDGNRRGTARWASGERRMGQREDAHDRRSLWVMRGTSPVPVSVRIGLSDGNYTEILDGDVKESSLVAIDVEGGATVSGSPPVTPFGPQQGSRRMF